MATAHFFTMHQPEAGLSAFTSAAAMPVLTSARRLKRAIAEANASLMEDIADMLDTSAEPVTFSSGEAAIAVGWSYIDDLETCLSSVNIALDALGSRSAELARTHFGDGIAKRVRLLNETALDTARYMLERRICAIGRAFSVAGSLVEIDNRGRLRLGPFTLTYASGDMCATVGSDQQAWIIETGTVWQISVREVTADLACGNLTP